MYNGEIEKVLITKEQIEARVDELAQQIDGDYAGMPLTLICTLKGGAVFTADLMRRLKGDVKIDFLRAASYGDSSVSAGEVALPADLTDSPEGRHLLIVEDIIDTGFTLLYLKEKLAEKKPLSVKICALLDKKSRRKANVTPDYTGFSIEDEFVVGYGMDFAEKYRNLPEICVLKRDAYER